MATVESGATAEEGGDRATTHGTDGDLGGASGGRRRGDAGESGGASVEEEAEGAGSGSARTKENWPEPGKVAPTVAIWEGVGAAIGDEAEVVNGGGSLGKRKEAVHGVAS